MAARVVEDVPERVAGIQWATEQAGTIAVNEHRAFSAHDAIHGVSEADSETLHAARYGHLGQALDDQMEVVSLDRVDDQAEAVALVSTAEAPVDRAVELGAAKTPDVGADS
jgi:hypothetical protein